MVLIELYGKYQVAKARLSQALANACQSRNDLREIVRKRDNRIKLLQRRIRNLKKRRQVSVYKVK